MPTNNSRRRIQVSQLSRYGSEVTEVLMRPMLTSLHQGITRRGSAIRPVEGPFVPSLTVFDNFTPQKPALAPQFGSFVGFSVLSRVKRKKVARIARS